MKTVEILYPEICDLFGDTGNARFLKACTDDYVETALNDVPAFVNEDVKLIYFGPMTENNQIRAMERLEPYKERICELIDSGTIFIATGNSYEIFGKSITDSNGASTPCMNILDFTVSRDLMHRESGLIMGNWKDLEIVGFKASFTSVYPGEGVETFVDVTKGMTMNPESKCEGIVKNNFFGTALLGPMLILNPLFTRKIFETAGIPSENIPFYKEMTDAYNIRVNEFKQSQIGIH